MKKKRTTLETVANPIPGDPKKGDGYWVHWPTFDLVLKNGSSRAECLSIYLALHWMVSDFRSPILHVTYGQIAQLAGLEQSRVERLLPEFVTMRVIDFEPVIGMSAMIDGLIKITYLKDIKL